MQLLPSSRMTWSLLSSSLMLLLTSRVLLLYLQVLLLCPQVLKPCHLLLTWTFCHLLQQILFQPSSLHTSCTSDRPGSVTRTLSWLWSDRLLFN